VAKSLFVERRDSVPIQIQFSQFPESGERFLVYVRYFVAPEQQLSQLRRGTEERRGDEMSSGLGLNSRVVSRPLLGGLGLAKMVSLTSLLANYSIV